MDATRDAALRATLFAHLERLLHDSLDGTVRSADVNALTFEDRPFQVIGQRGIRRVAGLEAALSFTTVYRAPGAERPYEDEIGPDGLLHYKYHGLDADHPDNRALRVAMLDRRPMAYFVGVAPGVYLPQWPVYLIEEDRASHEFAVAVDEGQTYIDLRSADDTQKRYAERLTKLRLHQPLFRARVLRAYNGTCSMCHLRHTELLDAAHILPDFDPRSRPVVPNGLALCKIHHAAFDKQIVGVRPDLGLEVRDDVLAEVDGPMLRYGLQALHGERLTAPRLQHDRPDEDWLTERYDVFRSAS